MIGLTILSAAAALMTASAGSASAQPAAAPPPAVRVAAAPPDILDEVVCQRLELTGSRANRPRVCKTRREWNELRTESQGYLGEIQRRAGQMNSIPGG